MGESGGGAPLLEAEEPLDLVPADDEERDGDREEHRHHDVEAVVGETALLPRPDARLAAGAVVAVAELDRGRVDRERRPSARPGALRGTGQGRMPRARV